MPRPHTKKKRRRGSESTPGTPNATRFAQTSWTDYFARLRRWNASRFSPGWNAKRKECIPTNLKTIGVLEKLTAIQQDAVADFVFDVWLDLTYTPDKEWLTLRRRGPAQLRKLRRKAAKLQKAFNELNHCAASIGLGDDATAPNVNLAQDLDEMYGLGARLEVIRDAIDDLDIPLWVTIEDWPQQVSTDKISLTCALHQFLTKECGLTRNDSSQRIAKIENLMWHGNITEDDPGSRTPDRSPAILKRLKRC